jgi:predicted  nucleic acid-binding Zn-ribbon protein
MYQCKDCHEIFDQVGEIEELPQDEVQAAPLIMPCCPHCGSERFTPLPEDDPREER